MPPPLGRRFSGMNCVRGAYFTNISSAFPFHPNLNGQGAYQDLLTLRLAGFLPG